VAIPTDVDDPGRPDPDPGPGGVDGRPISPGGSTPARRSADALPPFAEWVRRYRWCIDALVVYLDADGWRALPELAEAAADGPGVGGDVSAFCRRLRPGVAVAWEPEDDRPAMRGLSFGQHRAGVLAQDAEGRSPAALRAAVELVEETRRRLRSNVTEELALEALAYRLEELLAR